MSLSSMPLLGSGVAPVCNKKVPIFSGETSHFWPGKSGDLTRSGQSPHAGPKDLSEPAWVLNVPHASPKVAGRDQCFSNLLISSWLEYFGGCVGCISGVGMLVAGLNAAPVFAGSGVACCLGAGTSTVVASHGSFLDHLNIDTSTTIDRNGNIYIVVSRGDIVSLRPDGSQRWVTNVHPPKKNNSPLFNRFNRPATPYLLGEHLYIINSGGIALKLCLETGKEIWSTQYACTSGYDGRCVTAHGETVIVMGFPGETEGFNDPNEPGNASGSELYALEMSDGSLRWKASCLDSYNLMPTIWTDSVVFSHSHGGVSCLDLATGAVRWSNPSEDPESRTTGGAALGDNGYFYVTHNFGSRWPFVEGYGVISAYDVASGKQLWRCIFAKSMEANAAPTVFRAGREGKLIVATGLGVNAGFPRPVPKLPTATKVEGECEFRGEFVALDAETGEILWTFEPEVWRQQSCRGSTIFDFLLPDAWTNAVADVDGTVYAMFQSGILYAIDGTTGKELSRYDMESAGQSSAAMAHGMLVVASCKRIAAFFPETQDAKVL